MVQYWLHLSSITVEPLTQCPLNESLSQCLSPTNWNCALSLVPPLSYTVTSTPSHAVVTSPPIGSICAASLPMWASAPPPSRHHHPTSSVLHPLSYILCPKFSVHTACKTSTVGWRWRTPPCPSSSEVALDNDLKLNKISAYSLCFEMYSPSSSALFLFAQCTHAQ